jgi:hypothetical protein
LLKSKWISAAFAENVINMALLVWHHQMAATHCLLQCSTRIACSDVWNIGS